MMTIDQLLKRFQDQGIPISPDEVQRPGFPIHHINSAMDGINNCVYLNRKPDDQKPFLDKINLIVRTPEFAGDWLRDDAQFRKGYNLPTNLLNQPVDNFDEEAAIVFDCPPGPTEIGMSLRRTGVPCLVATLLKLGVTIPL